MSGAEWAGAPGASFSKHVGFVSSARGARQVHYVVIDGYAIHEGDIVLGTARELADSVAAEETLGRPVLRPAPHLLDSTTEGLGVASPGATWPGARIPYVVDRNVPSPEVLRQAMDLWQGSTSIRFEERDGEEHFVLFRGAAGWFASLGRAGGEQVVGLAGDSPHETIHELGHTIGLWHEHSRPDREQHVRVLEANIDPNHKEQFEIGVRDVRKHGDYDYDSVMHYAEDAFAREEGLMTIESDRLIGNRESPSEGDIATVNALYA